MWCINTELYHHGIKSQHWGERRYQNPDGSYTEEGRKRYGIGSDGHASVSGTGRYFKDKYSGSTIAEAKRQYKAESKAYERDYRREMANRFKTKESKQDVHNRLREKYGTIEYDSFEKDRKSRSTGKKLLAAAAASTAALVAKKIGDKNQKIEDNATRDALAITYGDASRIRKAGDSAYMQPKREELNKSLHKMNSLLNNDKYKNTQLYKKNEDWFLNKETDLNNMYNRAWGNTQQRRSENNKASAWKSMKPGTHTTLSNNPHITREQSFYGPEVTGVTRSMPMRSRGQAMQYAPKSNSFTRSSNGLRRKYNPSWY